MPVLPVAAAVPAPSGAPAAPPARTFASLLESRTPFRPEGAVPAPVAPPAISALASVERAQARLDAVLAAARSGRTFTAAELIGLQAEAYRCAQTVDLAARLVEQGAQSVKQALNTQL
jgi:excinuclease UvrABC helicase subunit UvrB